MAWILGRSNRLEGMASSLEGSELIGRKYTAAGISVALWLGEVYVACRTMRVFPGLKLSLARLICDCIIFFISIF
jgi:hypothetical protein